MFSWAFLPALVTTIGVSLVVATDETLLQRVGKPLLATTSVVGTLLSPHHHFAAIARPTTTTSKELLLASAAKDPVFEDLRFDAESRSLSLPPSEQLRQEKLQELEDERLERCRSRSRSDFDQCFWYGTGRARQVEQQPATARLQEREEEGNNDDPANRRGVGAAAPPTLRKASIPTW